MIQQLSPLLGLNASSLDLSEAEYNHLMSRPTFGSFDPTPTPIVSHSPIKLEEVNILANVFLIFDFELFLRLMESFYSFPKLSDFFKIDEYLSKI